MKKSRSCINNGDGNRKIRKPVPNTRVKSPEVNPTESNWSRLDSLGRERKGGEQRCIRLCSSLAIGKENKTLLKDSDQSRRCVDERIGKKNEGIDELDEDNLSPQREQQENKTLLKDSDQSRRCVDERIGKKNEGIDELDEDNLSPQREQQFKVGRKNKNKTLVAKRAKFDVEGGGSLEFDAYKDKVLSDDYCNQKATVTKKLQVGVLKNKSMNVSVMPYSSRRKNQIRIPHLSKEIISNILVRLSAEIIHDVIRYVSPVWYNIVHDPYFIDVHLLKSTTVLFIQRVDFPEFAHSVEIRDTDVKITKIGYPFRGQVCATCDGLVLYSDLLNEYILHVANPVTKQHVSLPSLQSFEQYLMPTRTSTLAYAASTRDYKVVLTCEGDRCLILTLGIDNAWREIEMKEYFRMRDPISVGGFVYWAFNKDPVVLCLDVETERFYKITSPILDEEIFKRYLAMGSSLSLVARDGFLFEVWVLRKPETGEWTRMPNIDIEGQRHMYERVLFPHEYNWRKSKVPIIYAFAWMKDGEVLIFRVQGSNTYIVHNLKTGQVYSPTLDEYVSNNMDRHHPHIHSLVSFRSNLVSPLSFPPRCTMCNNALSSPPLS